MLLYSVLKWVVVGHLLGINQWKGSKRITAYPVHNSENDDCQPATLKQIHRWIDDRDSLIHHTSRKEQEQLHIPYMTCGGRAEMGEKVFIFIVALLQKLFFNTLVKEEGECVAGRQAGSQAVSSHPQKNVLCVHFITLHHRS